MNTTHEEQRWLAVMEKDHHSDGSFVYAVRSTGIYCKPHVRHAGHCGRT